MIFYIAKHAFFGRFIGGLTSSKSVALGFGHNWKKEIIAGAGFPSISVRTTQLIFHLISSTQPQPSGSRPESKPTPSFLANKNKEKKLVYFKVRYL